MVLANTKIGDNSTVKDFCSIEDSSLATNVEVGPFARLRNGAVLDDSAKIGNFVEIKKSKIGQGSKANHHTYLGDAHIGKKAYVAAGSVITSNVPSGSLAFGRSKQSTKKNWKKK